MASPAETATGSSSAATAQADFGMIGLGVMGSNLALNIADHGCRVAVWNLEPELVDRFMAENGASGRFIGTKSLEAFVASLKPPRRMMMMITAGRPVDLSLEKLRPMLEPGDVVVDGGNSWFQDTRRREADLRPTGIQFVGSGVSGGEEGARHGPSLMPGGAPEAYEKIRPVFEQIAAKTDSGPCVTYCGPDGAGHFVKTVHNGIEYGDMQLIAEAYDLLRRGLGLEPAAIADIFAEWNGGDLQSYLIEITSEILTVVDPETGKPLVDVILDKAGQKGTGKWTDMAALDMDVPIPTIAAAIDARLLSAIQGERAAASRQIQGPAGQIQGPAGQFQGDRQEMIRAIHDALLASKICSYAQGMDLIRTTSTMMNWDVNLRELARIWKGGCIIRARFLDSIMKAYERDPNLCNLLLDPEFSTWVQAAQPRWRRAVATAVELGIPTLAMGASLFYFDSYRTLCLPQNLTQAQRDYFGAHTYVRVDHPERGPVHTDWLSLVRKRTS